MATFNAPFVPVFNAGATLQASDFNTLWFQNASFFQNRIVFRARQATTATTLPSTSVITAIGFDAIDEDPYSGWNAGTFTWIPPVGYSGIYQVTMTVRTAAPANLVDIGTYFKIAGATYGIGDAQGQSVTGAGVSSTFTFYLIGGQDGIQGNAAIFNSGANVLTSLTAGQQSTMEIIWVGSVLSVASPPIPV